MAWSLDWFAAEKAAKSGAQIRRAGWNDKHIVREQVTGGGSIYFLVTSSTKTVVQSSDFGSDEFNARDWTDELYTANPCAATPAYNTTPIAYGAWTNAPIFLPPPPPGFADP